MSLEVFCCNLSTAASSCHSSLVPNTTGGLGPNAIVLSLSLWQLSPCLRPLLHPILQAPSLFFTSTCVCFSGSRWLVPFPCGSQASLGTSPCNTAMMPGWPPQHLLMLLLLLGLLHILSLQLNASRCRSPQPGCGLPAFSAEIHSSVTASLTHCRHHQWTWWYTWEFLKGEIVVLLLFILFCCCFWFKDFSTHVKSRAQYYNARS